MRSGEVALVAAVFAACSRPPSPVAASPTPDRARPTPAAAPAAPPSGEGTVEEVCGTAREAALRARLTPMVACGRRRVVHASATVNGHAVDVISHDGDPCCTDTGPPEMMDGAEDYLDGVRYEPARHGGQPFTRAIGPLTGLDDATAGALLRAMLVLRGARVQALTAAEQSALFARWPAARAAVTRDPPGLTATPEGRALRVWNERALSDMGATCRLLERHEVTLTTDGRMVFGDPVVFGEGQRMGRPCAAPLP